MDERPNKASIARLLPIAIRGFTFVVAASVIFLLTSLATGVFEVEDSNPRTTKIPSRPRLPAGASQPSDPHQATGLFWPSYPGCERQKTLLNSMNGLRTLTEDCACSASAGELIDYYRREFNARGWTDVTEETYKVNPENWSNESRTPNALHEESDRDERLRSKASDVMDAKLVMTRGNWSVHASAAQGPSATKPTLLRFFSIERRSLEDLPLPFMQESITPYALGAQPGFKSGSEDEHTRYQTEINMSTARPEQSYSETIEGYRKRGWKVMSENRAKAERSPRIAWMTRGNAYVTITVQPRPDRLSGSLISCTEATPR
ncbi:MAG: hypothetical protein HY299_14370 [Verrucomicrobia bacterium]|nr:hypothetical protein [Verrucomicrobiota bacterium]